MISYSVDKSSAILVKIAENSRENAIFLTVYNDCGKICRQMFTGFPRARVVGCASHQICAVAYAVLSID